MTRTLRAPGRPDLPAPTPVLLGGVILLAVSVTTGLGPARTLAALLLLISAVTLGEGVLQRWTVLLGGLVCVMLFIPVDRSDVQVHLPFALEPYRAVMIVLLGLWIGSLLIDP